MNDLQALYDFAEAESIPVDEFPLPQNGSVSVRLDGQCYIGIDRTKIKNTADEAVHLAHELGHCMTGSFYNPYTVLDERSRHEYRANVWAIKRLCPLQKVQTAYQAGCREVWEFAEYLNITCDFAEKVMLYYRDEVYMTEHE